MSYSWSSVDQPCISEADEIPGRTCGCAAGYFYNEGCQEMDACKVHPCTGAEYECVDLPTPAGLTTAGRKCICDDW